MAADLATADFTEAQRGVVETAPRERYQVATPVERVDARMRLDPHGPVLTSCPALYWSARGAHLVVVKLAHECVRAQFFYDAEQHSWTGRAENTSLIPRLALGMACTGEYDAVFRSQSHAAAVERGVNANGDSTPVVNPGTVAGLGAPVEMVPGNLADLSFDVHAVRQ